jgi:phosphatidylserine/phosphatidylglycerophosphate/cardiolipin synthase-like enzyme
MLTSASLLALLLLCAGAQPAQAPAAQLETRAAPPLYASPSEAPVELVESWPLETTLDHPDIRDAKNVWLDLVAHAQRSVDFAEFYASNQANSPLEHVVRSVEAAAARGVKVRWLGEEKFYKTYPETMDRLGKAPGAEVRRFDVKDVMGGVLHAKYFLVDGEQAYLGSQNFDWRSLEHIQELGVRTRVPQIVAALRDVFELDWALSRGAPKPKPAVTAAAFPVKTELGALTFVASPKDYLPDEALWDLPRMVKLIDSAKSTVRVQVLTYRAHGRGGALPDLEEALQRAASRGVKVELIVSDWATRKSSIGGIKALHAPPNLTVKVMTIPPFSGGYVPFARVVHAKYMVIDGQSAWVGTSNWEKDYFYKSRNVGLIIEGGPLPARLDAFFADNWNGKYVETVDPAKNYVPPRTGE